jgi:antiviral helicase SKI2
MASDALPMDDLAASLGVGEHSDAQNAIENLEKEVLAPVKDLNDELWRWQVYVILLLLSHLDLPLRPFSQAPINLPLPRLILTPLPATHTILPTTRGIDRTFTHWREALAPRPPAHPTLSSSTTRAFGDVKNFVRGKGSYAPFKPGGLEAAATTATDQEDDESDEEDEEEGMWKTRAPGLKRGVKLDGGGCALELGAFLSS